MQNLIYNILILHYVLNFTLYPVQLAQTMQ